MCNMAQFLICKYEAFQARHRQIASQEIWLQNSALIFSAVIWSWALGTGNSSMSRFVLTLPSLMTLLFIVKTRFLFLIAKDLHKQIDAIEAMIEKADQNTLSDQKGLTNKKINQFMENATFTKWLCYFWSSVLGMNLIALIFGWLYIETIL